MKRQRFLLNHNPETAPVIGKVVEVDGKKKAELLPPHDKNPVLIEGIQILQLLLDNEPL